QDAVTEVCDNGVGEVTLEGTITADDGENLALTVGCDLTLDLNGFDLTVENPGEDNPAIHVPGGWGEEDDDAHLRITDTSEDGNGTLAATGGEYAAAIGGSDRGNGGDVTISGGVVEALVGHHAAAIGGGRGGDGGTVKIHGGEVTAVSVWEGAGIGGGYAGDGGTVEIHGGEVTANSFYQGAAIGGGPGGDGGTVEIHGGEVRANGGSNGGAGIGGGYAGDGGTVEIHGGEVTATTGTGLAGSGAGIGGGGGGDGGTVEIHGGEVEASGGGNGGAGIGGGFQGGGGTMTISGGEVTATGGFDGAGIGGGFQGAGGTVTISGGEVTATAGGEVTAAGGTRAAGIGGGDFGAGGDVTISGGEVTATGGTDVAGVGAGLDSGDGGSLTIEALAAEGSAEHGGGSEDLRAPITWPESVEGDLYALAETSETDEGNPVFEVNFGYVLEVMDFRDGVDQAPVVVQDQEFLPFGGEPFTGGLPDETVPEGFTFTGWRDGAPDGDVVAEEDLAGLLESGSVFLYATAARAELDPETIVAGETATVTMEAFNTEGALDDVTGDAEITVDGEPAPGPEVSPTQARSYTVGVEYRGASLPHMSLEVEPGEADSLVVDGPTEVTEAETVTYTVELADVHGNAVDDVTSQIDVDSDVSSNVGADEITVNDDDEIVVEFVFTPEELVDRELVFTYTDENGEEITVTVEVEVSSAVEDIELDAPSSVGYGETESVTVEAWDAEGDVLGDVTDYAVVASDGDDDEVDGAEVRFTGAGERELTVTYRGHAETATVLVDQIATNATVIVDEETITAGEDAVMDVTVESQVPDEHTPTGEVGVWLEDADFDEDEPLATGPLSDREVTLEIEGLTEAEDYELVVRYPGTTDLAPSTSDPVTVTVEPAAPVSIEVTGPQNAVETATASYQVQAFDTYGNLIGNVTTET
ncbi:Ig-like domain repeat protein, partial [Nesterenkonia ebinurensis]|uniref:Ig-like domain repeat protein n=1 Tax=Nesterenkonia ebinurensis TaxID=2608252 RepID=UPI00168AF7D7